MKVYRDRQALLDEFFPKGGICAEIGVCEGVCSKMIASSVMPQRLHLIDVWAGIKAVGSISTTDAISLKRITKVSSEFLPGIKTGRVVLHQGLSPLVLSLFPDSYFNWLYIDGDHSYEGVLEDLLAAERKVTEFIAGHDIAMPGYERKLKHNFPGVKRAVDEFCQTRGGKMVAVTQAGPREEPDVDGRSSPSYVLERV